VHRPLTKDQVEYNFVSCHPPARARQVANKIIYTVYMTTSTQPRDANSPVRQPCSASWFRIVEDRPRKQGVARHYQRPLSRVSKLGAEIAFEARTAHPTLCGFRDVTLPYEAEVCEVGFGQATTARGHATLHGCRKENQHHPLDSRMYVISANEGSIPSLRFPRSNTKQGH
jgi:hypothetical protein